MSGRPGWQSRLANVTRTEEGEEVSVLLRAGGRVEQVAVPVGASLSPAVRGDDEQGRTARGQLVTHLGDTLTVAAAAVVHALPWEKTAPVSHQEAWGRARQSQQPGFMDKHHAHLTG